MTETDTTERASWRSKVGTTVFCGTWNFEQSRGICPLPRIFHVFTEFCGIRYWLVI